MKQGPKTTIPTATDAQIRALKAEAEWARDAEQVNICTQALAGDEAARAECARVIADAAAMDDEPAADTHRIDWSDGRSTTHDSYEAAIDAVVEAYPDASYGHAGDLAEGGDRTLVWSCEEDSVDDDGARAVASIRLVAEEVQS